MKHTINKTYMHFYKIQPNGKMNYLYSILNKQVRGKYALHEELEVFHRVRISNKLEGKDV